MKTPLEPGESPIEDGMANLQRGWEAVGGHLYLTDRRLVFESHAFNVQTGATEIALPDIRAVELGWAMFLGVIPLTPNALVVHTATGAQHRFVLWGRAEWKKAIDAARTA